MMSSKGAGLCEGEDPEDVGVGLLQHHPHHSRRHPLRCVCAAGAVDEGTERQAGRRTDGRTDRQTDRRTDRQTDSAGEATENDSISLLIMASKCPKCDKTVYFGKCWFSVTGHI